MWRRTTRDRVGVLVLVAATLAVLTVDFRTNLLSSLSGGLTQVVAIFQTGVRTVTQPIEGAVQSVQGLRALRTRNDALRRENEILRRQAATFTDLARENARLREELRLTGSLDIQTISARVVGASLSGLDRSVVIDKGSESGILRDTAVLAPEGLLGRISWVGSKSAKVLLITDAQSSVGVKIGDKGETGLVSGTGKSVMRIELVERASLDRKDVKTGDVVLTSGQGGVFPPGVPIGIVEDVNLAPRGTSYEITVRPFARMSRLDVVAVAARPESRS